MRDAYAYGFFSVSTADAPFPRDGVDDVLDRRPLTSQEHPARLLFLDVTRVVATLMMVQGHTLDVLLLPDYRTTAGFYVWSFLRGLTSCLFLFVSGFAFSVATYRQSRPAVSLRAHLRRARRVVWLIAIGYLLHFPGGGRRFVEFASAESWRGFLAVDILQCIALTLGGLQVLLLLTRTRGRFIMAAVTACLFVVAITPTMWRLDAAGIPQAVAAYLSPRHGSLFPLFPWSAYMLLGAALGAAYQHREGGSPGLCVTRRLLPVGAVMVATAILCASLPFQPFGVTDFWSTSPNQFLLRAGLVLLIVSCCVHASRYLLRGRTILRALSQQTLAIYVGHVCLVYGSAWNVGWLQQRGHTMTIWPALGHVVALWTGMTALAFLWHQYKQYDGRTAQWLQVAAACGVALFLFS